LATEFGPALAFLFNRRIFPGLDQLEPSGSFLASICKADRPVDTELASATFRPRKSGCQEEGLPTAVADPDAKAGK
jgi:hypothetical protein